MALTISNWILFGIIIFIGTILTILRFDKDDSKGAIMIILITFIVSSEFIVIMTWINTHTASGIENYKNFQSELSDSIEREITITAEDGREIFYYKGKINVESNHEDNYIKFDSEEGYRYIIYYGIQDTIKIIEMEE
jgi:hypothetical protein